MSQERCRGHRVGLQLLTNRTRLTVSKKVDQPSTMSVKLTSELCRSVICCRMANNLEMSQIQTITEFYRALIARMLQRSVNGRVTARLAGRQIAQMFCLHPDCCD